MFFNKQPLFFVETPQSECFKAWAEHQHSLTDKLVQLKGSSQLEVLFQNWIKPNWWDTYFLQINDELIYQREIIMRHNHTEYWYARTVIPETCYEAAPEFFDRLNSESIKNLIFGESQVSCSNRICYPVDEQCLEFYWVKKYMSDTKGTLWCRLAEYQFQHKASFYLMELLLPELGTVA
jgi:chorismate lyase